MPIFKKSNDINPPTVSSEFSENYVPNYSGKRAVDIDLKVPQKVINDLRDSHHLLKVDQNEFEKSYPKESYPNKFYEKYHSFIIMPDGTIDALESYHSHHMKEVRNDTRMKNNNINDQDDDKFLLEKKLNLISQLGTYESIHYIFEGGIRLYFPYDGWGQFVFYQIPTQAQMMAIKNLFSLDVIGTAEGDLYYQSNGEKQYAHFRCYSFNELEDFFKKYSGENEMNEGKREKLKTLKFFRDPFSERDEKQIQFKPQFGNLSPEEIQSMQQIKLEGIPQSMRWPGASSVGKLLKLAIKIDLEKQTKITQTIIKWAKNK